MTDDQAQVVQEAVEQYLGSQQGRGFDVGLPQHFTRLVAAVAPRVGEVAADALHVVTAICLLGSGPAAGLAASPPATMRDELFALVQRSVPEPQQRLERTLEFAIAYGCGKWRQGPLEDVGWAARWPGAWSALTRAMIGAVRESDRWLRTHVVGYPPKDADTLWHEATWLAWRLIRPEQRHRVPPGQTIHIASTADDPASTAVVLPRLAVPGWADDTRVPGSKAVWTLVAGEATLRLPETRFLGLPEGTKIIISELEDAVHLHIEPGERGTTTRVQVRRGDTARVMARDAFELAIWECTCGTTHCVERHRLEAWESTQLSLWTFVASAVKGPQPTIQTGSFVQGMYFPLLA